MRLSWLFLLPALAGCESHPDVTFRDDSPTPVPPIFELTHIEPEDGSGGVDRNPNLLVVFSSEVDGNTVDAGSVSLGSAGTIISTGVEAGGFAVQVAPLAPLAPIASFALSISSTIAGLNGVALGTSLSFSFTTRDVKWGSTAAPIADLFGTAGSPSVALDASGDGVAVWTQTDGGATQPSIRASEYDHVGGVWSPPHLLELDAQAASMPMVVLDPTGNGIAIWQQVDGTFRSLYGARYVKGTGWGARVILEATNAGDVVDHDIACNSAGAAVVVFTQFDGTRYNALAKRFAPPSSWSAEEPIELLNDTVSGSARVSVTVDGTAVALWEANDGTRLNVWANRYVPGGAWGTAQVIETNSTDAFDIDLGMDAQGNAIAVWISNNDLWANRMVNSGTWGTAGVIELSGLPALDPKLAVAANGAALASWGMADTTYYPWSAEFDPSTGWMPAAELVNVGTNSTTEAIIDRRGRPVVFWHQLDADGLRYSIWSKRKLASGWESATLVETSNAGTFSVPTVAAGPEGDLIAVWSDAFGSNRIIWSAKTE